jgi:hypothetical protein
MVSSTVTVVLGNQRASVTAASDGGVLMSCARQTVSKSPQVGHQNSSPVPTVYGSTWDWLAVGNLRGNNEAAGGVSAEEHSHSYLEASSLLN